jgi:hypothetical protein
VKYPGFKVKIRKVRMLVDHWRITVYNPQGFTAADIVWRGNAARNWLGLQGAADMALTRAWVAWWTIQDFVNETRVL